MAKYDDPETENAYQTVLAGHRALKIQNARESIMEYAQYMRPDPNNPEDCRFSQAEATPLARLLCQVLERVDAGKEKRVCVSVGPQFGKSDRLSRDGPSWLSGRNPHRHIILGSYNDTFAQEFGGDVRELMQSERFKQVFPAHALRKGSEAKDYLVTTAGGKMAFVGVGGSGSGKPADYFFVDDPFKNDEDAQSATYREKVWKWFNSVTFARCHNDTAIIVVHCMVGGTPVLMADGSEKPLRDVKVGDEIASYDGEKLCASRVVNWANQGLDSVFTIRTISGTEVSANGRHPFLVDRNGVLEWVKLKNLKAGDHVLRATGGSGAGSSASTKVAASPRGAKDTATPTTTKQCGPAGTALLPQTPAPAERRTCATDTGSATPNTTPLLSSRMENARCAESPPAKTSGLIGVENCASTTAMTPERSEGCSVTTATSPSDMVKPKTCSATPLSMYAITRDVIVDITATGEEDVFDIQVADTENFIANGLISHNTRWHEDDLIGRMCDPEHPERHKAYKGIAERWNYYNLPAIIEDPKMAEALGLTLEIPQDPFVRQQFGTKPMASLWERRKSLAFLAEAKMMDARVFGALYMGKPSPDTGTYFKAEDLIEYHSPEEMPQNLRWYAASDHAVSLAQKADSTVLGCIGVDEYDNIWVPPDVVWGKMETDTIVDEMLNLMKIHKPQWWLMESELISKSFGPFLKKRMHEEKVYITLIPKTPSKDKRTRARAIQGRVQMHKVRFPAFATWWPEAKSQMLKFDYGTHEDFVDWLSWIGLGLTSEYRASPEKPKDYVKTGTLAWIKAASSAEEKQRRIMKAAQGW